MAEQTLLINNEGDDADFYEKIEAPRFVDFRKPERRHANEDRYWFCSRVGCDLKHEEEMDYEAIEKDFVLRVMAARSPNVGFQKALNKRIQSNNMKCPRTAPPKSSKSRVSRLAVISSVCKKLDDSKVKTVPKSSKTPKAEIKQSSNVPKALTTPRNKKRLSNGGQFRSVRRPKTRTTTVLKNRVVAKALVFHSPRKSEKTTTELESNSTSYLCSEMKKLKITSANKHLVACNSKPLDTARKELKGREVKSRVFDSLYSKNYKSKETTLPSSVKKKNDRSRTENPLSFDGAEINSTDMEIDEKSRNGSLGQCSVLDTSESDEQGKCDNCSTGVKSEHKFESASSTSGMDLQSSSQDGESRETDVPYPQAPRDGCEKIDKGNGHEKKIKLHLWGGEVQKTVIITGKENDPAFDEKENNGGLSESKDNDAAPDENRKQNQEKKHVFGKHENSKTPKKVSRPLYKKSEKSSVASGDAQGVKFNKPKLTNPKPFRFRTDERGILKEANLEKKLHQVEPVKKQENIGVICSEVSKELQDNCSRKIHKQVSTKKKSSKVDEVSHSPGFLEKTKSPTAIKQKIGKSRSIVPSKKEVSILTPGKLRVIPELTTLEHTAKSSETDDPPTEKLPASRSSSLKEQRRPATIPKEPIFQRLHKRRA